MIMTNEWRLEAAGAGAHASCIAIERQKWAKISDRRHNWLFIPKYDTSSSKETNPLVCLLILSPL